MKNKKIILFNDKKLFVLLNEFLENELIFYQLSQELEYDINYIKKEGSVYAIVDSNINNLYEFLKELKPLKIKVILVGYNLNSNILRNCFKDNLIEDYIEKENYIKIEKIINNIKPNKFDKILLKNSDLEEVIIKLTNIYMISYDRTVRRSLFETNEKDYLFSRKTLSEIEDAFSPLNHFLRIERGLIINLNKVYKINPELGCIIFDNNKKIYYSRSKLKEIKNSIIENININPI